MMTDRPAPTTAALTPEVAPSSASPATIVRARTTTPPSNRPPRQPTDDDAFDLALIAAHKAGDPTALSELLTRYQDRLYSVCLRMIGNHDQAMDMLQDAMVRIIAGLNSFDGRARLSTWMIRITMNACLTELRRRKLRRHASLDAPAGDRANNSADSGTGGPMAASLSNPEELSPLQRVVHEDDRRRLFRALSGLDPEQRAILILRDAQGLDYRRIAEVLNIPEGTVKSRLFRSRLALRQEIERLENRPGTPG